MKAHKQLNTFLEPYNGDIQSLTIELRQFIIDLAPEANELIWDNYNAVAIAYSKSEQLKDAFCHIAVYSKHVNFGFNRGTELTSHHIKLEGKGKLIRHLKVKNLNEFLQKEIQALVLEAAALSELLNPTLVNKTAAGKSLVMSVSAKKLRPSKT